MSGRDGAAVRAGASAAPATADAAIVWPRLRLALAVLASLILSFFTDPWLLACALLAGLAPVLLALRHGLAGRTLLRRLLAVNAFVALLWLTLPWQIGPQGIGLSAEGLALAQQLSLRSNAIALWCLGLLGGMDAFTLARAAAGLGLPDKLARLLGLTVRYFGLLDDSRRRIDRAMRARGFRPACNRRTVEVLAQQVALLLVHALLRAERVGIAMRARGFSARGVSADSPARMRSRRSVTGAAVTRPRIALWRPC